MLSLKKNHIIIDLCDEVLWLNDGEVVEIGKPDEVVPRYEAFMAK